VKDQPIFAWGGLWRDSAEWGPVYSGAMTDCNDAIRPVHDRMPILLMPEEYDRWLNGSFDDLLAFQARCFPDDLIEMTRTDDRWQQTESERAKAAFRAAIQGEWRVLIEDQLPDQAYALAVDGKLATFTGEAGNIEFAEAVAIASFPSGAGIHINEGLRNIKSDGEKFVAYLDPVTNETESVPIVLRHGDKVEAAGFMFRPWAVPGAS